MVIYHHPKLAFYRVPLIGNVQELNPFGIWLVAAGALKEVITGIEDELVFFVDYQFIMKVLATDAIAADSSVMIIFTWFRLEISMQMDFLPQFVPTMSKRALVSVLAKSAILNILAELSFQLVPVGDLFLLSVCDELQSLLLGSSIVRSCCLG